MGAVSQFDREIRFLPIPGLLSTLTTWLVGIDPGVGRTLYLVKSEIFYGCDNMRPVHRRP